MVQTQECISKNRTWGVCVFSGFLRLQQRVREAQLASWMLAYAAMCKEARAGSPRPATEGAAAERGRVAHWPLEQSLGQCIFQNSAAHVAPAAGGRRRCRLPPPQRCVFLRRAMYTAIRPSTRKPMSTAASQGAPLMSMLVLNSLFRSADGEHCSGGRAGGRAGGVSQQETAAAGSGQAGQAA